MMPSYKIIRKFITKEESSQLVDWISLINHTGQDSNHHLTELSKKLNGKSYIFDISKTELTSYVSKFQSISDVSYDTVPTIIYSIIDRLANEFGFSKDHVFLQAVDMNNGGKINPHYDAAVDGYVNYKCNISVLSKDYDFFIDSDTLRIEETDLYCFPASLYKHWTNEFNSRRVFLSFGFIVPYSSIKISEADPRVRLSKRIKKYFQ